MTAARCSSGTSFRLIRSFSSSSSIICLCSLRGGLVPRRYALQLAGQMPLLSMLVRSSYVHLPRPSQIERCHATHIQFEYSKIGLIWLKQAGIASLRSPRQSALRGGCDGVWGQFGGATEVGITSPSRFTRAHAREDAHLGGSFLPFGAFGFLLGCVIRRTTGRRLVRSLHSARVGWRRSCLMVSVS
jgi:hypothetical protein